MLKPAAVAFVLFTVASLAQAAEVKCLCPIAMRALLGELGPRFESATGHKLSAEFGTLGANTDRVAKGEAVDVAVVLPRQAEDLEKQGKLMRGSRVELARAGYGAIVRKGTRRPDMASVDAFKRTLANVATMTYGDPAAGGPVGVYIAGMLERLGVATEMKVKTRFVQNAELVVPAVVNGDAEIGFTISSATTPAVEFIPLPMELQNYTVYMAGVVAGSKDAAAATAFIEFLSTPDAKGAMRARGFETR